MKPQLLDKSVIWTHDEPRKALGMAAQLDHQLGIDALPWKRASPGRLQRRSKAITIDDTNTHAHTHTHIHRVCLQTGEPQNGWSWSRC